MIEYNYNSRTLLIDYDYQSPDPSVGYSGGVYLNDIKYKNFDIMELPKRLESDIIDHIYDIEQNRKYEEAADKADWEYHKDR